MALRIEDYGLIGNLSTAALVGKNGSIDWLCLPNFDSGACFTALLGDAEHGYWRIAPVDSFTTRRRYREGTLVLETEFRSQNGRVLLTDCMIPEASGADLIRVVEGLDGEVELEMTLKMRFDYGSLIPWVQHEGKELTAIAGPDMVHVYADVALSGDNLGSRAAFRVRPGEKLSFALNWHPSCQPRPARIRPLEALENCSRWWKDWSSKSAYDGKWKEAVQRSLITLKALSHAETGGIVAAPTTSLPEKIGGVRNWDYRLCWIRDATFTLYSLMTAGYVEEARAWREWLLRAVAGSPSDMRIMYGIGGQRRLTELELEWLPGYERSRPVRVGNLAYKQHQLDIFGEVMDALFFAARAKLKASEAAWNLQGQLLSHLMEIWEDPDEGIWEVRGPRRDFTHSKVMAWVALDRGIRMAKRFGLPGPLEKWKEVRRKIHAEVCQEGFNTRLGSFTQYYGSDRLDASLLMLPLVGFLPIHDPRMKSTVEAIEKGLMHDGFILRYHPDSEAVDGLPPGEGVFLACSFWYVDNLRLLGRMDEANEMFERLLSIRNDLGLLAEEYDPRLKRQVGNFPQAFSHVSLVNSARNLSRAGGPAEDRLTQAIDFGNGDQEKTRAA